MRRFSKLAAALLPLAVIGFGVSTSTAAPGANGAERVRVIVAYKDGQRSNAQRALAMAGAEVHYDFASLRGYAVSVPAVSLEGLSRNPAFDYIEEDAKRYALAVDADGGDEQPYGIAAVQAAPTTTSGPLDTNAGKVTVCIIDSGLDITHPDHAASYGGGIPRSVVTATPARAAGPHRRLRPGSLTRITTVPTLPEPSRRSTTARV